MMPNRRLNFDAPVTPDPVTPTNREPLPAAKRAVAAAAGAALPRAALPAAALPGTGAGIRRLSLGSPENKDIVSSPLTRKRHGSGSLSSPANRSNKIQHVAEETLSPVATLQALQSPPRPRPSPHAIHSPELGGGGGYGAAAGGLRAPVELRSFLESPRRTPAAPLPAQREATPFLRAGGEALIHETEGKEKSAAAAAHRVSAFPPEEPHLEAFAAWRERYGKEISSNIHLLPGGRGQITINGTLHNLQKIGQGCFHAAYIFTDEGKNVTLHGQPPIPASGLVLKVPARPVSERGEPPKKQAQAYDDYVTDQNSARAYRIYSHFIEKFRLPNFLPIVYHLPAPRKAVSGVQNKLERMQALCNTENLTSCMIMEKVDHTPFEGVDLKHITHVEQLPARDQRVLAFVKQIITATFNAGHEIIADFKPANMKVRPDGTCCLIDFSVPGDSEANKSATDIITAFAKGRDPQKGEVLKENPAIKDYLMEGLDPEQTRMIGEILRLKAN